VQPGITTPVDPGDDKFAEDLNLVPHHFVFTTQDVVIAALNGNQIRYQDYSCNVL